MNSQSKADIHDIQERCSKAALLLLVVIPLIPEIVVLATSIIAKILRCDVESDNACAIGTFAASEIIRHALGAASVLGFSFSAGLGAAWLVACYCLVTLAWSRFRSRLWLAFALSLGLAILPYAGPLLSIDHLINPRCVPNAGSVVLPPTEEKKSSCMIYGGDVGPVVHDASVLADKVLKGDTSFAFVIFIFYGIIALIIYWRSTSRPAR